MFTIPAIRLRPLRSFVLATAVLGAAAPALAQQNPAYGVVHDNIVMPQASVTKARDAGFGWLRYLVYWSIANPSDGKYIWNEIDFAIAQAEAANLKVSVTLSGPPAWIKDLRSQQLENAFRKFATELVRRYRGRVHAWGFGSEYLNIWPGMDANEFVKCILVPGYQVAKTLDPSTLVAGPDIDRIGDVTKGGDDLREVLKSEKAHGKFADVFTFHVLRHSLDRPTPGTVVDLFKKRLDDLRYELDNYSIDPARPVWLTELGDRGTPGNCNEEPLVAYWLRDSLQKIAAGYPWITRSFIYHLLDGSSVDSEFGLLYADGTAKASMHELKTALTGTTPKSYLAEGASGAFFDLDIAIANPHCAEVPARVTFLKTDGTTVVTNRTLAPRSRQTIRVDAVAGVEAADVSAVVESLSGPPLVVERSMFWDQSYYAGHTGSAVTRPETRWYFGEGSQGFFDTWLLLANAGGVPANVTVRFLRETGGPVVKTFRVAPTSRLTVFAGSYPSELVGTSFSMVVESDRPIIAERAMYFGASPFYNAGHESAGVPAPATNWFHAEGATGNYFDTYILVGNPNDSSASVTFSFLLETGHVITRTKTIGPQARLTVNVETEDPLLANAAVSTTVSADVPVVSERAMYWAGAFSAWQEAHNSFGVTETGTTWALAEGRVGASNAFETYILLANPTPSAAQVRVTLLRGNGLPPAVAVVTVPPTSRYNVHVNALRDAQGAPLVANESFGALIESINRVPIVVERAMYWNAVVKGVLQIWAGGANATATRLQ